MDVRPADAEHDLAYWTQGDNSSFIDNRVVMESGFDEKVIWYANGLGAIYDLLTLKLALPLFLLGSVMLIVSRMGELSLGGDTIHILQISVRIPRSLNSSL